MTPLFKQGFRYKLRSQLVRVQRTTEQPDSTGQNHEVLLMGQELAFFLTDENGVERSFVDARCFGDDVLIEAERTETNAAVWSPTGQNTYLVKYVLKPDFSFQDLASCFEIPTPPDAAYLNPELFNRNLTSLDEVERRIALRDGIDFKFRGFQRRDVARAALYDGCILASDTGLGKTLMTVAWALLKVGIHPDDKDGFSPAAPILVIAPESLHDQMRTAWRETFGFEVIELDCQETYLALAPLAPAWYISSFTQIARNGVKKLMEVPNECDDTAIVSKLMEFYGVTLPEAKALSLTNEKTFQEETLVNKALHLCRKKFEMFNKGIGDEMGGFTCVYSPSLADYVRHAFTATIIDEAVHAKSEDSLIGIGCRSLEPKFRCLSTATPIKNRLGDIFFLMWWATGGRKQAHARFPYSDADGEVQRFRQRYLVTKRDLTKEREEAAARGNDDYNPYNSKRKGVPTASVCNTPSLWKLCAPTVLRRKKSDIGEEIVPKIKHPIYVPMGVEQAKVYAYHLNAVYLDRNQNECLLAKLQALRSCAAAPQSPLLEAQYQPEKTMTLYRSQIDYIPKMAAALAVILECLRRGEQIAIGSAFHEPLDALSRRLVEAGVPHEVLDGRITAVKRAEASRRFRRGLQGGGNPVVLCGTDSMSEGHDWPLANNVGLLALSWAWDRWKQFIDRVWRITSKKPVNVYPIICQGTMDIRLESLIDEKGDSQELVLDGKLLEENTEEVDLNELMKSAISEFGNRKVLDERECEREWPALRARLREAYANILDSKPSDFSQRESPLIEVENAIREPAAMLSGMPIQFPQKGLVKV